MNTECSGNGSWPELRQISGLLTPTPLSLEDTLPSTFDMFSLLLPFRGLDLEPMSSHFCIRVTPILLMETPNFVSH